MKNLFIIANWKANKTEEEAIIWLEDFKKNMNHLASQWEHKEVIICPSYSVLSVMKECIKKHELPLALGSQDVSQFGRGAYTGEVPVALINSYIRFCIIGHSERRTNFNENDEVLARKVSMVVGANLLPIFCVQNENTKVPEGVFLVAYEPVFAIGTGNPDTPENANKVAEEIKRKNKTVKYVLYGGSVNAKNVGSFTNQSSIEGVLVGGASLDAKEFIGIIKNA